LVLLTVEALFQAKAHSWNI